MPGHRHNFSRQLLPLQLSNILRQTLLRAQSSLSSNSAHEVGVGATLPQNLQEPLETSLYNSKSASSSFFV